MRNQKLLELTRRTLLREASYGIGGLALANLLAASANAQQKPLTDPMAPKPPQFAPKAKNVIFLFMAGAPSQFDLFEPKPTLNRFDGQECPDDLIKGERFAFIKGKPKLLGSPYKFRKVGNSGHNVSELLPHFEGIADDVTMIHSVATDQFNHAPAQLFMNTGFQLPGRPSLGSWLTYGLGSERDDLPGFVVLISGENNPDGGKACYGSGFLPTHFQGVEFRSEGDPVLFLRDPEGIDRATRREMLDTLKEMNLAKFRQSLDPEIESRIAQYELAFRMQTSVPELADLSKESRETIEMYGAEPGKRSFANNCLLARRLVERGVRFVQLYHRGWDNHGTGPGDDIVTRLPKLCQEVDQAAAALVKDLKRTGKLDETLVIWGGEFGRTPMNEGRGGSPYKGRDHHPRAFTMWAAGGGIMAGGSVGETDDLGYNVTSDPVHVHDLHATILHLMGLDHTRLTYRFQGRDFRLTDVHGHVVQKMLA
jgi:hypothetical protein